MKLIKSVCLLKKNQKWTFRVLALASKGNWIHSVKGIVLIELQLGKFSFLLLLSKNIIQIFVFVPCVVYKPALINTVQRPFLRVPFLFLFASFFLKYVNGFSCGGRSSNCVARTHGKLNL